MTKPNHGIPVYDLKDPIKLVFHVYDWDGDPVDTYEIPIGGMTRKEARNALDAIQRSDTVGHGWVLLENGNKI